MALHFGAEGHEVCPTAECLGAMSNPMHSVADAPAERIYRLLCARNGIGIDSSRPNCVGA